MIVTLDKVKVVFRLPLKVYDDELATISKNPYHEVTKAFIKFLDDNLERIAINENNPYSKVYILKYELGSFAYNRTDNQWLWMFNPNKLQSTYFLKGQMIGDREIHPLTELKEILSYCKFSHFTRLDIALDLNIDLNAYKWLYSGSNYFDNQGHNNSVETIYLGSRSSDKMFRIYDKEKECKANDELIPKHMDTWRHKTRIELEYKKDDITLNDLTNEFNRLVIIPKNTTFEELKKHTDIKTSLTLLSIIQMDRYDLLNEFNKNTKSKYLDIIKKVNVSSQYINPITIDFSSIILQINDFKTNLDFTSLFSLPF